MSRILIRKISKPVLTADDDDEDDDDNDGDDDGHNDDDDDDDSDNDGKRKQMRGNLLPDIKRLSIKDVSGSMMEWREGQTRIGEKWRIML